MDLRVAKTKNAIINSFLSIRAKKPLEKITVRELCQMAMINKSTFTLTMGTSMNCRIPWKTRW